LIRPGQTLVVPRLGFDSSPVARRSAADGTYTVRRADTLWDIARAFGTSVAALQTANGLGESVVLHPGQKLRIPESTADRPATTLGRDATNGSYLVRSGDTLYDIARRFNITVGSLKRANGLTGSRIHPGDVLKIPSRG
jgi:LysM repeat protein